MVAPDGEVLSPFDINRADDRETFQQELRFASQLDGPLNFISGVFYQHEEIDFCVAQILGFLDLAGAPTSLFSFFGVNYGPFNQTPYILCSAQKSDSTALYTEGTYDLTERLTPHRRLPLHLGEQDLPRPPADLRAGARRRFGSFVHLAAVGQRLGRQRL